MRAFVLFVYLPSLSLMDILFVFVFMAYKIYVVTRVKQLKAINAENYELNCVIYNCIRYVCCKLQSACNGMKYPCQEYDLTNEMVYVCFSSYNKISRYLM